MNETRLHIPVSCHESWEAMTPIAHGRHCATCNHAVVDVTSMPLAEGRRTLDQLTTTVLTDPGRRTCVRAHVAPSGRLVAGRRKLLTHALATMLSCTMAGCVGDGPDLANTQKPAPQQQTHELLPLPGEPRVMPRPQQHVATTMGDVCVPMGKIVAPALVTTKGQVAR